MEEYEIKFLEVNVPELEKKLMKIGAKKVGDYDYHRVIMDYPDYRMRDKCSWVRLRTDGKETTLTYKQAIVGKSGDRFLGHTGMKEIEVGVEDYEKTLELLKRLGLVVKTDEINKRIRYKKDDVTFDIDFWPQIPPFLEIESDSIDRVKEATSWLELDPEKGMIGSAGSVYKKYGYNIDDYSSITFEKMTKK